MKVFVWPSRLAMEQHRLSCAEAVIWGDGHHFTWEGQNSLLDYMLAHIPAASKTALQDWAGALILRQVATMPSFQGIINSRRLPHQLWRLLLQLKAAGLNAENLYSQENARLRQLGLLLAGYQDLLNKNNLEDKADALQRLLAYLRYEGLPKSFQHCRILEAIDVLWLRASDMRLLMGLGPHLKINIKFALPYSGNNHLLNLLDSTARVFENQDNVEIIWPDPITDNYFKKLAYLLLQEENLPETDGKLIAHRPSGRYSEVEFLLTHAKEQLKQGVAPHEIALIFPDLSIYGQMASDVAQRLGLPLFFRRAQSLVTMPLVNALLELLQLEIRKFSCSDLIKVLQNPYLFNFFDNILQYLGAIGKTDKPYEKLIKNLVPQIADGGYIDSHEQSLGTWLKTKTDKLGAQDKYKILTKFCEYLYNFINQLYEENNLTAFLKIILTDIYPHLFPQVPLSWQSNLKSVPSPGTILARDWQSWQTLGKRLQEFLDSCIQIGYNNSSQHPFYILQDFLSRQASNENPVPGIQVLRLEDTWGGRFKVLLAGGLCQGDFPVPSSPFFLSRQERLQLTKSIPIWRTEQEEFHGQESRLVALLAGTSQLAVFTSPLADSDGQSKEASLLFELLGQNISTAASGQGGAFGHIPALEKVQDLESLKLAISYNLWGQGGQISLAMALNKSMAQQWQNEIKPLPVWPPKLDFSPSAVQQFRRWLKQFEILSASSLDTYQFCPQQWFFYYIMKLSKKDIGQYELSPADEGNIIHALLAAFFKNYRSDTDQDTVIARLEEIWQGLSAVNCHEFVAASRKTTLLQQAFKVINFEIKAMNMFKPAEIEFTFSRLPAIDVTQPPYLKGRIDRIDRYDNILRITDYKNTKYTQTAQYVAPVDGYPQSLQLPIYMAAVQALYPEFIIQGRVLSSKEPEKGAREEEGNSLSSSEGKESIYVILRHLWNNITNANFHPQKGTRCNYCQFQIICQITEYEN
ncbi:MAG: PD-(D/E)XK nuclease family protein [Desulfarculales bacterium]|jgi:ATP-dependent helicase/DNAse subunit B|nr:PD-(D/E)XK nuclease family protein [Desulfarculales bacterium]